MAERKIYSEPSRQYRTFVFIGTDVPVLSLLEHLKDGKTLDDFLTRFPDVTRERAVAFLEQAAAATESSAVDYTKKYDTVVSSGQAALRALLTLNGGATIAFLTFIGHLGEKGLSTNATGAFAAALQLFVFGTLSAVLGYGTIFLTNTFSLEGFPKTSSGLFVVTCLFGLASLVFFYLASGSAVQGFKLVGHP